MTITKNTAVAGLLIILATAVTYAEKIPEGRLDAACADLRNPAYAFPTPRDRSLDGTVLAKDEYERLRKQIQEQRDQINQRMPPHRQ